MNTELSQLDTVDPWNSNSMKSYDFSLLSSLDNFRENGLVLMQHVQRLLVPHRHPQDVGQAVGLALTHVVG